jgi:hypothetical protein
VATILQILNRIGTPGAPTSLAAGELGYNQPDTADPTTPGDALYIGDGININTLVGAARQVELYGDQTITGIKTIGITDLQITGGAAGNILSTNGLGVLSWIPAPSGGGGGIDFVTTDGVTLAGNGTPGTPLAVVQLPTARQIGIVPTGGTTITQTAASFNGSANVNITGFEVTGLDCGTY